MEPVEVDREMDALMRTTRDLFESCVQLDRSLPDEAHLFSINIPEPGWLADMIATAISLPFKERQTLLLLPDPARAPQAAQLAAGPGTGCLAAGR